MLPLSLLKFCATLARDRDWRPIGLRFQAATEYRRKCRRVGRAREAFDVAAGANGTEGAAVAVERQENRWKSGLK